MDTLPTFETLAADPRVVWTEDVLRFNDTDMNGHVNNAAFAVLCESGRVNLFNTRLVPCLARGETFFVIVRLGIEFRAELHYPGRVRTGTWIPRLGRSSIGIGQALFAEGGRLVATAEATCVLMERAGRRPTPFPDAARAEAASLLRAAS